jgi:lipopolysaccharide transport system ATP-binding protein
MPTTTDNFEGDNSKYAVITTKINKEYQKVSSSLKEKKRTWQLMLATLFKGNKKNGIEETFSALSDISLKIKKGRCRWNYWIKWIWKSTLLQIIAGTLQPSSGEIHSNGKIGALLELGSGFNPEFTGRENIYLNAKILGLSKNEVDKKYDQITSFSGIGDFVNQPVRTYSSGMVVRLAFSVIAHTDPDILIIDEALAVGDARFQSKCFSFLETFKEKGKTLLFVSHDINSIARLCSSAVLLHKGMIEANGIPKNVINEYSKIISRDKTEPHEIEFSRKKMNPFPKT